MLNWKALAIYHQFSCFSRTKDSPKTEFFVADFLLIKVYEVTDNSLYTKTLHLKL